MAALTTNHIAEIAGVSIGSVYQYFPDKQAILAALHERHVEELSRVVERALIDHAGAPRATLLRALIEALIEANAAHPECNAVLALAPALKNKAAPSFTSRLAGALRLALHSEKGDEARVFTAATMIDAFGHAAALRRPKGVTLRAAKAEAVSAVLAYLESR
ncbi:TetR/AcrR family transcriptional regulator [Sorangium sp. So ce1389]|uniref:TetR/AcrR family transcriptional regulator n=1 Tax=Sorangium sp. So ce1389 TaxID=3133336 RepID=UPI003F5E744B